MTFVLEKIYVNNYKSFHDATIHLGKFNIVAGTNNAGKSNFIDLLEFLQLAITHDPITAVKMKGGFEKIVNYRSDEDFFEIKATFSSNDRRDFVALPKPIFKTYIMSSYNQCLLSITINKKKQCRTDLHIDSQMNVAPAASAEINNQVKTHQDDATTLNISISAVKETEEIEESQLPKPHPAMRGHDYWLENELLKKKYKYKDLSRNAGSGEIRFTEGILKDQISIKITHDAQAVSPKIYEAGLAPYFGIDEWVDLLQNKDLTKRKQYVDIFSQNASLSQLLNIVSHPKLRTFNFDINTIRNTLRTPESNALKRDGSNLHYILESLKGTPQQFELIADCLTGIVNEVEHLEIERQRLGTDRVPEIIFKESNGHAVARDDISDGTLALLVIITALYSGQWHYLTAFEELERHLHMNAISYLMELFRDYTNETGEQILITTQSSEILRNVQPDTDALIFIYRDHDGNTKAVSSTQIPEIQTIMGKYQYNMDDIVRNDVLGYLGDYEEKEQ